MPTAPRAEKRDDDDCAQDLHNARVSLNNSLPVHSARVSESCARSRMIESERRKERVGLYLT